MNLHGLDIIVLVVVALTAVRGAMRGVVGEVLALFAWVAMIFALKIFHLPLAKILAGPLGTPSGGAVGAFVVLTGVTYLLGKTVANAIGKRSRTSVLGPIDRALGFGFGALKGLILASLAYLFLILVLDTTGGGPTHRPAWLMQARTYPLLSATSGAIADFVDRHPTVKMLALSFLVLIGTVLVVDATHRHIAKGYIYFSMAFAIGVEMLNLKLRNSKTQAPVHLKQKFLGERIVER